MEENKTLTDILTTVNFIKDNAVTKEEFQDLKGEVQNLQTKVTKIEATMVTKDHLDDKLTDLKGDLTVLMRKEDTKLKALVEILMEKQVISQREKEHIYSLEPFPQTL